MSTTSTVTRTRPVPSPPVPPPSGVVAAIARAHARRMLAHPLLWLATALSVAVLIELGRSASGVPELSRFSTFVGLGSAPLAAAALLVAHGNVSRPRRDGTGPLFSSLAARARHRSAGHLLGSLAAVVPAILLTAGWAGALVALGTTGSLDVAELAVGPAVVALASVAGSAAATWAPQRFAGVAALGLFATIQLTLHDIPRGTLHWLGWWQTVTWHTSADLWIRPSWNHLAYLLGVTAVLACIAVLRHGPTGRRFAALGVASGLMVGAGATQLPYPSSSQIDAVWNRIDDPGRYWSCDDHGGVEVCLFPAYTAWRADLAATVDRTLAPVPDHARPDITIVQRHHDFPSQLMNEFPAGHARYAELSARGHESFEQTRTAAEPADRIVVDTARWTTEVNDDLDIALGAAARAVGLSLGPVTSRVRVDEGTYQQLRFHNGPEGEPRDVPGAVELDDGGAIVPVTGPCRPLGQAREVVALWLAAQSSPARADLVRAAGQAVARIPEDTSIHTPDGLRLPAPPRAADHLSVNDLAVEWTAEGLHLAAQLLDRTDVARTISAQWAHWTDPATPAGDLVAIFELEPYPTVSELYLRAGLDPADFPDYVATWPDRPDDTDFHRPPTCP